MTCSPMRPTVLRPFNRLARPMEVIRQFTPNWFAATMGTGVLALAVRQMPIPGVQGVAEVLWWLTIGLFVLFCMLYGARWLLFFGEARRIFGHSTVSMFFGTIPMGLATILNGGLVFGLARWGEAVVPWIEALWWLDVVLALLCGVVIPYLMFTRQEHSIDQMTAVWLLPVVAAEVAAASGGLLVPHLADPQGQYQVLIASYVLWAVSLPVAFSILTILVLRMALHKLPPASMAASSWLALGPIGTGALGMMLLGSDAPAVFAANGLASLGEVARGLGLVAGIVLWGAGLWWLLTAVLITLRYLRQGMPFNLGWWGFTFPLGVYGLATLRLGDWLGLGFFLTFGQVLVGLLAGLWLVVAAKTLAGAWRGELFVSPCLETQSSSR
ncbi:TDT family transporter [Pseudomonas sp. S75]|uniref:TDT family transporter n=1 Tax=unclassified Pseudomonas TaxID=196821 RepID=UPI001903AE4F|nr:MULTISPECIES: TDT family transporter [unclassified Pseudomonas]MBJ9975567.1 TDT family transporter [Pseudomonas sp. S30]MBK0153118.1 TDT family transporter [Pseudomonas sp. S75]